MDTKTRNSFLGTAMFLQHVGLLQPCVIEMANHVARQGGYEIPVDIEESLSTDDKREIVKTCATTVLLGQEREPTELERLVMLHIVNTAVQCDFFSAQEAFPVMYELTGIEPSNPDGWTIDNWQSSIDSVVGFEWSKIERQLADLREKANRIVLRANDEMQHELAESRYYWEQALQSNLDYMTEARKPRFNDALAIYHSAANMAWQYKIEIATARPLF